MWFVFELRNYDQVLPCEEDERPRRERMLACDRLLVACCDKDTCQFPISHLGPTSF